MELDATLEIDGGVPCLVLNHDKGRSVLKFDPLGTDILLPVFKFADQASKGAFLDLLGDMVIAQELKPRPADCTCPMSLRQTGMHSHACPLYGRQ